MSHVSTALGPEALEYYEQRAKELQPKWGLAEFQAQKKAYATSQEVSVRNGPCGGRSCSYSLTNSLRGCKRTLPSLVTMLPRLTALSGRELQTLYGHIKPTEALWRMVRAA